MANNFFESLPLLSTYVKGFNIWVLKYEAYLLEYIYAINHMLPPYDEIYLNILGYSEYFQDLNVDAQLLKKSYTEGIGTFNGFYYIASSIIGGEITINNPNQSEIYINSVDAEFVKDLIITDKDANVDNTALAYDDAVLPSVYTTKSSKSGSVDIEATVFQILQNNLPAGTQLIDINYTTTPVIKKEA